MSFPQGTVSTGNLDTSTDQPSLARADLLELVTKFNELLTSYGAPLGIAGLDSFAQLPTSSLPTVPVSRGGTESTTASGARNNLGLGNSATLNVNTANGVANLNASKELKQNLKGAAAANPDFVWYADGTWRSPVPQSTGYVTQSSLKTSSGSVSGRSDTNGETTNVTLPGGQYGFYPQVKASNSETIVLIALSGDPTNDWRTVVGIQGDTVNDLAEARQRYIQSSPPYNLGDGDIPLFVFLGYRDGKLIATYEAQEPPWALNGPTEIHSGLQTPALQAFRDAAFREEWLRRAEKGNIEPVSDDEQTRKQYDMPLIPHPFDSGVKTVLIDPMGDEVQKLAEFARHNISAIDLIREGVLRIDNSPLKRCGPPGVDVVRARWH